LICLFPDGNSQTTCQPDSDEVGCCVFCQSSFGTNSYCYAYNSTGDYLSSNGIGLCPGNYIYACSCRLSNGLARDVVIGISVGVILGCICCCGGGGFLIFWCVRRNRHHHHHENQHLVHHYFEVQV